MRPTTEDPSKDPSARNIKELHVSETEHRKSTNVNGRAEVVSSDVEQLPFLRNVASRKFLVAFYFIILVESWMLHNLIC